MVHQALGWTHAYLCETADGRDGVGPGAALLARILQFMETPQYLRKCDLAPAPATLFGEDACMSLWRALHPCAGSLL